LELFTIELTALEPLERMDLCLGSAAWSFKYPAVGSFSRLSLGWIYLCSCGEGRTSRSTAVGARTGLPVEWRDPYRCSVEWGS